MATTSRSVHCISSESEIMLFWPKKRAHEAKPGLPVISSRRARGRQAPCCGVVACLERFRKDAVNGYRTRTDFMLFRRVNAYSGLNVALLDGNIRTVLT